MSPGGRVLKQQPAQAYGYPGHYTQPPPAASSLSPMAMSAFRDAAATGPQRAQPTLVIRSRPSAKVGSAILLTGAIIGAAFGITMRARQAAFDDTVAAQQPQAQFEPLQAAPPSPVAAPVASPIASPVAPVVLGPNAGAAVLSQGPAPIPPQAYANVPFGSLVVSPPPSQAASPRSFAAQPAGTVAMVAPPPKAPPPKHATGWSKPAGGSHPSLSAKVNAPPKEKDDGYKVASAGNDEPKEAPPPKSKPAKESREPKDDAKENKKAEAKPAKSNRAVDDADKVLKAAMGATENTL
jgi:hypothetical protein